MEAAATKSGPNEVLGKRLREAREAAGLTPAEVARRGRVTEDGVQSSEAGRGGLSVGALVRLARILQVPDDAFVDPGVPFDALRVPHRLLKTAQVSGSADLSPRDEETLARALNRAGKLATLRSLRGKEPLLRFAPSSAPATEPHLAGYRDAREVRSHLPTQDGALRGLRRLIEDKFGILVVDIDFEDRDVVGAACRLDEARVIAVRKDLPTETWRRFIMGHELGHHLRDLVGDGGEVSSFGVGGKFDMNPPPLEKRANAFSAMLLAPELEVERLISKPSLQHAPFSKLREAVEAVCNHFGIGVAAGAWHLHNLGYIDKSNTKSVLAILDPKPAVGFEEESGIDGLAREVFDALRAEDIGRGYARDLIGAEAERFVLDAADGAPTA